MKYTLLAAVFTLGVLSTHVNAYTPKTNTQVKSDQLVYLENTFKDGVECYATFSYPMKKGETFKIDSITYQQSGRIEGVMIKYHGEGRWWWSGFFDDQLTCVNK